MKTLHRSSLLMSAVLAALFSAGRANAAPFTAGNVAVLRVGDGGAALGSAATAAFIDEYTPAGVLVQSLAIPATGAGNTLTLSGTATSEGGLMRSPNGTLLCFAGYRAAAGTAGVVTATAATVPRLVGTMDSSGTVAAPAGTSTQFSGANVRSGATDAGGNYWGGGTSNPAGTGGVNYLGTGAAGQLLAGNLRWVNVFNGDLYFSSGAAAPGAGIHQFTGLPTAAAAATALTVVATQSPYGFSVSPAGTAMYVADDRTLATGGGIQRWNKAAGVWTLAYTLGTGGGSTTGARGLAVDWSGAAPVIFASTTETNNNRLITVTDLGAGTIATPLTGAGVNRAFRGVAFAPVSPRVPKPRFYTSNKLPPPNGVYVSGPTNQTAFANGTIIRNVSHKGFSQSLPPPPSGGSQVHSFSSTVAMEFSVDGGLSFQPVSAPANTTVRVTHTADIPPASFYDTEMLQLDIAGGTLPPGVMVRESPTRASPGKTTITPESGGFMIDSFFDIFTELSLDGGQNWSPALAAKQVDLCVDPMVIPPVAAPTTLLLPPLDHLTSTTPVHLQFPGGIIVRRVRHHLYTQSMPAPAPGPAQVQNFDAQTDMELSTNGGATFQNLRVPATFVMRVQFVRREGTTQVFDTEMLQLDLQGGDLPVGVLFRESPTRRTLGGTAIGEPELGLMRIHSFFDIFTEVSLDGGANWAAATTPGHLELQSTAPEVPGPSPNLPPPGSTYASSAALDAVFASGVLVRGTRLSSFSAAQPPPPPGGSQIQNFAAAISFMVSTNGGATFDPVTAPASCVINVTSRQDEAGTRYFDTEMLAMDIAGGGLPPGVLVRESPTKASSGRTSTRGSPGNWQIASFFDIFVELSVNSGMTWEPTIGMPLELALQNPDSDGDGLADAWELTHFGDLASDASDDNDDDGSTNGYEFLAGTVPTAPVSVLRPDSAVSGSDLKISFPTFTGHHYTIECSASLSPPWVPVVSNIIGNDTVQTIVLSNAMLHARRFYRVIPALVP